MSEDTKFPECPCGYRIHWSEERKVSGRAYRLRVLHRGEPIQATVTGLRWEDGEDSCFLCVDCANTLGIDTRLPEEVAPLPSPVPANQPAAGAAQKANPAVVQETATRGLIEGFQQEFRDLAKGLLDAEERALRAEAAMEAVRAQFGQIEAKAKTAEEERDTLKGQMQVAFNARMELEKAHAKTIGEWRQSRDGAEASAEMHRKEAQTLRGKVEERQKTVEARDYTISCLQAELAALKAGK